MAIGREEKYAKNKARADVMRRKHLEKEVAESRGPSILGGLQKYVKATTWDLIIASGRDYHLTYFARARLIDRGQDRVMWVQTCSKREIWRGIEISRMNEEEIRKLLTTVQIHARAIIDSCSAELIRHLEPLD